MDKMKQDISNIGEIVMYQPDETIRLEVRLEDETVWLTQAQMAELFQTTRNNITLHIGNIFKEEELQEDSVRKDSLLTAQDGKRYRTKLYNLDVIISVGYRVKSQNCRLFYVLYPQVGNLFLIENKPTLSVKSVVREFQPTALVELQSNAETIVGKLSFLCELVHISDDTTRLFYEKECIRCGWSVRELRRFIATNLHVRVGMSQNSDAVIASLPSGNSKALDIRQPYTFEFLGLRATEVLRESEIEDALLSHLQEFLLEMGKGFCFEARQKRFIIDDEYYYADLVFYHRILHCSVIVELKNDEFRHEHFGQLNAYVSYYKENEMHEGDNPPIGILLCTKAGKKMVEYATAGMDNKLFVSTYLLQLPDKSVLEQFIKDNDII